jgi:hypothetical protein
LKARLLSSSAPSFIQTLTECLSIISLRGTHCFPSILLSGCAPMELFPHARGSLHAYENFSLLLSQVIPCVQEVPLLLQQLEFPRWKFKLWGVGHLTPFGLTFGRIKPFCTQSYLMVGPHMMGVIRSRSSIKRYVFLLFLFLFTNTYLPPSLPYTHTLRLVFTRVRASRSCFSYLSMASTICP